MSVMTEFKRGEASQAKIYVNAAEVSPTRI